MRQLYTLLTSLTILCLSLSSAGQQVFNAGGGVLDADTVIFHSSLGEPIISNLISVSSDFNLSLGYLQPFACMEIGGLVSLSGTPVDDGSVVLYLKKNDKTAWRGVDTTAVGLDGTFNFLAFPDVDYVVKFIPAGDDTLELISYSTVGTSWVEADVHHSTCGADITADIELQKAAPPVTDPEVVVDAEPDQEHAKDSIDIIWQDQGNDVSDMDVDGNVVEPTTTTFTISGSVIETIGFAKIDKILSDPIPGLDIVLDKTPPGTVVAATTTDEDGFYQFDDIVPGNYAIIVDIPGIPQKETYGLSLNDAGQPVITSMNFLVEQGDGIYIEDSPTIITDVAHIGDGNLSIFPNPFNDKARVQFDNPDGLAFELRLSDISGKQVLSERLTGQSIYYLDRSDLPSGMYLLRIQNQSTQYNARVIIN